MNTHTTIQTPEDQSRFYVEWHDWPAALAACEGDKEKAAEACHNHDYDRRVNFSKFRAAVKFAHSKIDDDFFGLPRVYREELVDAEWDQWGGVEYWDCDEPDVPVFEAHPTEVLS